jgi:hypothetical protein
MIQVIYFLQDHLIHVIGITIVSVVLLMMQGKLPWI